MIEDIYDIRKEAKNILVSMNQPKVGLPSGLKSIDKVTNGFRDGELIIVAGNLSMGKSAFARGVGLEIAKDKLVLLVSLEMSNREVSEMCLTALAKVNYSKVIQEGLIDKYKKRLDKSAEQLSKRKLLIWDSSCVTVTNLKAMIDRINEQEHVDCVIIDYLQLMTTGKQENRQVEVATISRELKLLAMEYQIPVIAVSQINRQCEQREDKRPRISDLRDSGALGQDCDKCLLIHRPAYYYPNGEDDGIAEIHIAKNRGGPRNKVITCGWLSEYMVFVDVNLEEEF